jgi:hypothetical protein
MHPSSGDRFDSGNGFQAACRAKAMANHGLEKQVTCMRTSLEYLLSEAGNANCIERMNDTNLHRRKYTLVEFSLIWHVSLKTCFKAFTSARSPARVEVAWAFM